MKFLKGFFFVLLCLVATKSIGQTIPWSIAGNADATSSSFIGTTNAYPLIFKSNGLEGMRVHTTGNVSLGTDVDYGSKVNIRGGVLMGPTYVGGNDAEIILQRLHVGVNNIFTVSSADGGLIAMGGASSGGFAPSMTFIPDGSYQNSGMFYSYPMDVGTKPAFVVDSRKRTGGALSTQPLFGIASYDNMKMQVSAPGNLMVGTTVDNGNKLQVAGKGSFTDAVSIGGDGIEGYKLAVNGFAIFTKVKVMLQPWADYVFKSDYKLMKLEEVDAFIKSHGHLPEVPSAEEMGKNGADLAETQALLLKKIEELTLYIIEQNKTLLEQKAQLQTVQTELDKLKAARK